MDKIRYAGIGSRETPKHILELMGHIAHVMEKNGVILRSGGADGADAAFAQNVRLREIFLPWNGYNNLWAGGDIKIGASENAIELAGNFHPAWNRCSHGAKKLHGRNMNILLGADLDTPVDLIVCWTKDGKASGGTGQAMRAAEHFGIPIFNLYFDSTLDELEVFMNKLTGV